jgi:hypothetical protein
LVPEGDERERRTVALLRQVWLGLSAYRLFPGSTDRPGFVAAAERIDAAANEVLDGGFVDVEIHGDGFSLEGSPLPRDDALNRLALVCFERRVERLVLRRAPELEELRHLYDVLSSAPEEVREAGGAEEVLRGRGVRSIQLSAVGPAPVSGADHVPEDMIPLPPATIPEGDVLASELMLEDLGGSPAEQAQTVLARLHAVAEGLELEPGQGIDLQSAFHEAISHLPTELRRSLMDLIVQQVTEDPLAQRLLGTMSNAELTRALVDLGREGKDPVELARTLATSGVRHLDIVDLTSALAAGQEEAGTIVAGLERLGIDLSRPETAAVDASVTDVVAQYLSATETDDTRTMKRALDEERDRDTTLLALRDYLRLENEFARLGDALGVWAERVADAIRANDVRLVTVLVETARASLADADDDRASLFEAYARETLNADLVHHLAQQGLSNDASRVPDLLSPFGDVGVEVLIDMLADEEDRDARAQLLSVLRVAAAGHLGPVAARLEDPRWYVVRNAVSLLGAAGGPDVLDRLGTAARHTSPEVRREAARALVLAGGTAAVPYLSDLARDGSPDVARLAVSALAALMAPAAGSALVDVARTVPDKALRTQAVDELAGRPDSAQFLEELLDGSGPRLPWRLRRHVRQLLKARGAP